MKGTPVSMIEDRLDWSCQQGNVLSGDEVWEVLVEAQRVEVVQRGKPSQNSAVRTIEETFFPPIVTVSSWTCQNCF